MCIEVHGSERRYLPRRRPVHNFCRNRCRLRPIRERLATFPYGDRKPQQEAQAVAVRRSPAGTGSRDVLGLSAGSVENRRRRLGTRARHPDVWAKSYNGGSPMKPQDYATRILVAVTGLSPQIVTETLYALAVGLERSQRPFVPSSLRPFVPSSLRPDKDKAHHDGRRGTPCPRFTPQPGQRLVP